MHVSTEDIAYFSMRYYQKDLFICGKSPWKDNINKTNLTAIVNACEELFLCTVHVIRRDSF